MMIAKSSHCLLLAVFLTTFACTEVNKSELPENDEQITLKARKAGGLRNIIPLFISTALIGAEITTKVAKEKISLSKEACSDTTLVEEKEEIQKDKLKEALNTEKNSKTSTTSHEHLMEELAPLTQLFWINPNKDTLLHCKAGTKIYFPADIFECSPWSAVEINIEEFYQPMDFISRNLSTVSDSNYLESGGTVKITATQNGDDISLKQDESYILMFPRNSAANDMQTFYGSYEEDGIMNWSLDTLPEPKIAVEEESEKKEIAEIRVSGDADKWDLIGEPKNIPQYLTDEIKKLDDWKMIFYTLQNNPVRASIVCHLDGKIRKLKLSGNTGMYENIIKEKIRRLPAINLPLIHKDNYGYLSFGITAHCDMDKKKMQDLFVSKYEHYKNKAFEKVPLGDLNNFVLASNELGWVNCDRFMKPKSERTELLVETPNPSETKVYMIFEDFSSVVVGKHEDQYIRFPFAPLEEKVKLIAVSSGNGQTKMTVVRTKIKDEILKLDDFRSFTLSELQDELNNTAILAQN